MEPLQLVPVGGGARAWGRGQDRCGSGDWPLEEELEEAEGGASGLEAEEEGTQALGAGLQPVSGAATVQEKGSSSVGGGATGSRAEPRPLKVGPRSLAKG